MEILKILNPTPRRLEDERESSLVQLEIKVRYLVKQGIQQTQQQLSLDKEMMSNHIDLAIQSLFGRLGAAEV